MPGHRRAARAFGDRRAALEPDVERAAVGPTPAVVGDVNEVGLAVHAQHGDDAVRLRVEHAADAEADIAAGEGLARGLDALERAGGRHGDLNAAHAACGHGLDHAHEADEAQRQVVLDFVLSLITSQVILRIEG